MKLLKSIDAFLFGTPDDQEGCNALEKLYFYVPIGSAAVIALMVKFI